MDLDAHNPCGGMGARMRLLRLALGYRSVAAFARATGIDEDTIYLWEKGERPSISPAKALKLKKATRVTLDWLYFGDHSSLPTSLHRQLTSFAPKD